MNNKYLGARGELVAREYLKRRGYKIVQHNYRSGHREIDLIVRRGNKLVFVEIKTRIKTTASLAENPLTHRQTKNLRQAIIDYCRQNRVSSDAVRLDLIIILVDRETRLAALRHYPGIL